MVASNLTRQWPLRLAGVILIGLFAALTFLLGCFELQDNDLWWHLKGGEWILAHGRTPGLDPFSFASADQRWIDLHWLFQIAVALAHRAGGIAGVLILTSAAASVALIIALAFRPKDVPLTVALLGLMPGLALISFRLDPRPEMLTLFYLSVFLAVLNSIERHPRLAWLLPFVQVLWVNSHSLYFFGPIVLTLWWTAWIVMRVLRASLGPRALTNQPATLNRHLALASLGVLIGCFVNPYGLEALLFPLKLYPKVAQEGNLYKAYIQEFMSPRDYASSNQGTAIQGGRWFLGTFQFMLLLLPLAFLIQGLSKLIHERKQSIDSGATLTELCIGCASVTLVLLQALCRTHGTIRRVLPELASFAPFIWIGVGILLSWALRRQRSASILALTGGIAMGAWSAWLDLYLWGEKPSPEILIVSIVCFIITAFVLVLQGTELFHLLLAAAFIFLGLQSVNSMARFGLAAGVIVPIYLGPWAVSLFDRIPVPAWKIALRWSGRLAILIVLVGCLAAVKSERYSAWIGDRRHLALREHPLTFAHDAARFAGQPGLPSRALVYDIAQACVYVYHNAPDNKVYMDARLETPTLETFKKYAAIEKQLNEPGAGWPKAIDSMGDMLLMISHDGNAEAEAKAFLNSRWRCIYFDAMAALFVPQGDVDGSARFPTVDPAVRAFLTPPLPSLPQDLGAAWAEARAAFTIGTAISRRGSSHDEDHVRWILWALNRTGLAFDDGVDVPGVWAVRGSCFLQLHAGPNRSLAGPHEDWDSFRSLRGAQASYCFRKALAEAPNDERVLEEFYHSLGSRKMLDAQREAGALLLATGKVPSDRVGAILQLINRVPARVFSSPVQKQDIPDALERLLRSGRPAEAAALAQEQGPPAEGWKWPLADRVASAWMHLGYPAQAREIWGVAKEPPSESVRLERLAGTYWAEGNREIALNLFNKSRRIDPKSLVAAWSLSWLHIEGGDLASALRECRGALSLKPPKALEEELSQLEKMLVRIETNLNHH